ncbi:MAG: hypothetical protein OH319_01415 [Candidatus Parvarchaeota archaeon]|nr:hypothetical protein [Candidatus Jingweiarchaeum tengchongense]MCW1297771.1 hypothetical protein [Candidatus Jingweiarchaeum tengchongense]MCW1299781.1 hypothetical protein [Candidatus Jingweiarchaeum tengchongense]MCW1304248.1 hypothetical protein [Candidatus Jingweiarchaeum tengchongense]MCW1305276.1 hypothetical protein [Candidatus Jingweiarchaeum tengchongense]
MDKKGIEGLPLKYVIVILIAAIVIALVLDMMGIIRLGILSSTTRATEFLNESITNATSRGI